MVVVRRYGGVAAGKGTEGKVAGTGSGRQAYRQAWKAWKEKGRQAEGRHAGKIHGMAGKGRACKACKVMRIKKRQNRRGRRKAGM